MGLPPGPTESPPVATLPEGVDRMVREIREGLAQISARELELRQREQDFRRQYRDMEQAVRQATAEEQQEAQQRLVSRETELNKQATELASRQTQVNQLAEQLRARQIELEQQRAATALQTQRSRQQAETLKAWYEQQRQMLRQRAETLIRHEQDFDQRVRQAREELARQRSEQQRRQSELETRAAKLVEVEQSLRQRSAELEERLGRGASLADQFERRQAELAAEQARLEQQREQLEQATQKLEAERARLEQDQHQVEQARLRMDAERTQVAGEWDQLEEASLELAAERNRLVEARRQVEKAKDELEDERARLAQQQARLADDQDALEANRLQLARGRGRLEQATQELEAEGSTLLEKQAGLDRQWEALHQQRQELSRQADDLNARKQKLEQEQADRTRQAERLAGDYKKLREQAAGLRAEKQRLAEWEARLAGRQAEAEESLRQTRMLDDQTRHQQQELLSLQKQLEVREQELRQAALSIEVDRQELEKARASSLLTPGATGRAAPVMGRPGPPMTGRAPCRVLVAAAAGLLAAVVWLAAHPPLYRASEEMGITTVNPAVAEVTAQHRRRLLDPYLLRDEQLPEEVVAAWQAAVEQGRVTVVTAETQPAIWLHVTTPRPEDSRRLAAIAGEAYARRVQTRAEAPLPPEYADLMSRRQQLEADLQARRQQQAADQALLADRSELDRREQAQAAVDRLESELTELASSLEQERAELAALLSAGVPRGDVRPAEVEKALSEDAIYVEDRKEFQAAALEYRTELAVAMLLVVDPATGVLRALGELANTLQEQRALDPPTEVGAVLEDCAAEAGRAQELLSGFVNQWRAWVDSVQTADLSGDVTTLVSQQNRAADAARRLADEVVAAVDRLGARIETLASGGDGRTREVVVAAVLRGDHAALKSAVEALLSAAGKTALSDNFELDARDRKLRGLRQRLDNRQAAIAQQLQLQADKTASDRHLAEVEQVRQRVRELERRREELVTAIAAGLRMLREVDQVARQRDQVELRAGQRQAEIEWLSARLDELDHELAGARQQGPQSDRVSVGRPLVERIGPARYRNAALAGAGVFAVTWLACAWTAAAGAGRARRGRTEGAAS
jgi:hypothetical protein